MFSNKNPKTIIAYILVSLLIISVLVAWSIISVNKYRKAISPTSNLNVESHSASAELNGFSSYINERLPDNVELVTAVYDNQLSPNGSLLIFTNVDSFEKVLSILNTISEYLVTSESVLNSNDYVVKMWSSHAANSEVCVCSATVDVNGCYNTQLELLGPITLGNITGEYTFESINTFRISASVDVDENQMVTIMELFPNAEIFIE